MWPEVAVRPPWPPPISIAKLVCGTLAYYEHLTSHELHKATASGYAHRSLQKESQLCAN